MHLALLARYLDGDLWEARLCAAVPEEPLPVEEFNALSALSGCTALEELDLSYNDLNSLAALRSLTQLRTLNITGNPALTADMVRSLQEALPACQIITDIDLSMPEPPPEPPAETPQP